MGTLKDRWEQLKSFDIERRLGLRPEYPKTAIEIDGDDLTLVHTRVKGGSLPMLEQVCTAELPRAAPTTINDLELASMESLAEGFSELFQKSGLRPGKLSLVLPDNVAKITLLDLPERPPSKRQLDELIRFKTRRGTPFRLSEASMSYQILPGEGKGIQVLVAMVRQALVERYETALESIGARPGLVDLCTPNLINLFRPRLDDLAKHGDVALLNCAGSYFSMVIIRRGKLVFFRCKTYSMSGGSLASDETLRREMTYSRSYYEERLNGEGIRHLLVRRGNRDGGQLEEQLAALGAASIEWVDPTGVVSAEQPGGWNSELAQRVAPALGAVLEGLSVQVVDLNLASRQFKNEMLPWILFVLAVAMIGLVSWWNVSAYTTARAEMAYLLEREENIKRRLGDLKNRQVRTFAEIDRSDLGTVLLRTEKANEVIRWKSFSWTRLFNVLQEVQPHDVQMISINPVFHGNSGGRRRDGIDPELVPISVEGFCKNLFDFFEFQGNLLQDSRIDSVEPDSWSTDETTGETLFTMRFLYDPRIDVELELEREAAEEANVAVADEPVVEGESEQIAAVEAAGTEGEQIAAVGSAAEESPAVATDKKSLAAGPQKKIRRNRGGKRGRDKKEPSPLPPGTLDGEPKMVEEFGQVEPEKTGASPAGSDGGRS